ncbi:hypothetical protein ITJ42_16240 [Clavibacter michiganensis subsp. phaseoli]|uniref:Uncharacterized protein n=1 Tax=Clavibacter phaseoli TaxID=1734031 RepID=A0A8I0SAV3_9MICO|nr:DUF6338 family protein [Clavibacter phaseoli]MBF4632767.1 hypothetical protein [Clavibacter phaseoli]
MIPTTLTGILLLLILLLPGFVFVTLRERHQPTRKLSVFRETSVVLAATTASYLLPALVVTGVVWFNEAFRRDVALALSTPATYVADHPLRIAAATAAWVLVGTGIGALLGTKRLAPFLVGTPGGSAWWKLFDPNPELVAGDFTTEVTATLDDGTVVTGTLYSWNRNAEDGPDREFTLQAPLWLQTPKQRRVQELDAAAITISARTIRYITVRYIVSDE